MLTLDDDRLEAPGEGVRVGEHLVSAAAVPSRREFVDLRNMRGEGLGKVTRMLAAYLTGWMGGPPVYQMIKGTMCLTDPDKPYAIGPKNRHLWLDCMDETLRRIDASDELKTMLKEPIFRVADTVRNTDESSCPKERDPNIVAMG